MTDFAEFFADEYERVVRSLTLALDDRGEAEDAAQGAFEKALRKWTPSAAWSDRERGSTWSPSAAGGVRSDARSVSTCRAMPTSSPPAAHRRLNIDLGEAARDDIETSDATR